MSRRSRLTRKGFEGMVRRWKRDADRFEAEFPWLSPENCDPATEVARNLHTAIAEGEMFLGASDWAWDARRKSKEPQP